MARIKNWVKIDYFAEEYNITQATIYTFKKKIERAGVNTDDVFTYGAKGELFINMNFIMRRANFKLYIWNRNHELYYDFIEHFKSQFEFAELLEKYLGGTASSWNNFLTYGMWSTFFSHNSILDYKVPDMHWKFFRFCRAVKRSSIRKFCKKG